MKKKLLVLCLTMIMFSMLSFGSMVTAYHYVEADIQHMSWSPSTCPNDYLKGFARAKAGAISNLDYVTVYGSFKEHGTVVEDGDTSAGPDTWAEWTTSGCDYSPYESGYYQYAASRLYYTNGTSEPYLVTADYYW